MTNYTKYTQLVFPDLAVKEWMGFSLRFLQSSFEAPAKHRWAWDAWEATEHKHLDDEFPNAYVPVWFSSFPSALSSINMGHVLLWDPDLYLLFGPPTLGYGRRGYTLEMVEEGSGGQTKLVGWSEDLNGIRIIKQKGPRHALV